MRKNFFAAVCLFMLLFLLTACNDQVSAGPAESTDLTEYDMTEKESDLAKTGQTVSAAGDAGQADRTASDEDGNNLKSRRPKLELSSMYIYEADDDNEQVYLSGSHDTLRISADSQEDFAALSAVVDLYMANRTDEVKKQKDGYLKQIKENPPDTEFSSGSYEITDNLYVRRADRSVLSILESCYSYAGGAHGFTGYRTVNFDAATGKQIALDEVVADREGISEFIKNNLKEEYDENEFFEEMPETVDQLIKGDEKDLKWTLDPCGITFYFDAYEIGPYASGSHSVTVPYEGHKDLLTDAYRPESGEGYVFDIPKWTDYHLDVDQDGKADRLTLSYETDDYDTITSLSVSVNNKSLSVSDFFCYGVEPKVVLAPDGRVFLYAWCNSDNDFVNMYIFDLSLGSPVSMGSMALSEAYTYIEEEGADYTAFKCLITDPQYMPLCSRFDLLSTYNARKDYYVSDSPVPVSQDKYFSIMADITLVSAKDIVADLVDEQGKVSKASERIPAGSSLKLLRTDGEKNVDAVLSDGRIVRLLVTGTYPQYINGIDINELFEQTYFAG